MLWPIYGPIAKLPQLKENVSCTCRLLTKIVEQWPIFLQTIHGQKLHHSQQLQLRQMKLAKVPMWGTVENLDHPKR